LHFATELHRVLEGHRFPVQALVFAPDNGTLTSVAGLTGSPQGEEEVLVWDTATGRPDPIRTESFGGRRVLSVALDTRTLATVGMEHDRTVRLWDLVSGRERARLGDSLSQVGALAFSRDGRQLATADNGNNVKVWDATTGRVKTHCQRHSGVMGSLAFAPGGALLAGGAVDRTVRLWDVATGAEQGVLVGHTRAVMGLAFSPDAHLLASGDFAGVVKLWDVAARTEWATLTASEETDYLEEVAAVAFSPDGRVLAVALGRAVQLWDVTTAKRLALLEGHKGKVTSLAFSPGGTRLASGSYDRTVRLWDVGRPR
jgi:WD40 repeat protein